MACVHRAVCAAVKVTKGTSPIVAGWGKITGNGKTLTCAGIIAPSGTGPWKYDKTQGKDVIFKAHSNHWRAAPAIQTLTVKYFSSHSAVMKALLAGSLDVVVGSGVLEPADLNEIKTKQAQKFDVFVGPVIQNRLVILNGAKAPTKDIEVRKAIIHAVNKAKVIEKELYGWAAPVDSLFPKNAPYAGVDLLPRWDYDQQKSQMLQCPADWAGQALCPGTECSSKEDVLAYTGHVFGLYRVKNGKKIKIKF